MKAASVVSGLAIGALLAGVTGCGSRAEAPTEASGEEFTTMISGIVAEAESGGASEQQRSILAQAAEDGQVTVEAARTAARATIQCLQDSGLAAEYVESATDTGAGLPGYTVRLDGTMSEAAQDEALRACEDAESTWVNMAYQMQPSTQDAQIEYVMSKEAELRACLEDAGIETDPNANGYELARMAVRVPDNKGTACLAEAGITNL